VAPRARPGRPGYAELHCHSAYSFLDGASLPEELALRAAELGYPALALTDHDGVWGAMEHAQACSALGVRPIVGAELAVRPPPSPGRAEREPGAGAGVPGRGRGEPAGTGSGAAGAAPLHVTLLVESRAGWRNLCRLITEAHAGTRWPGEGGPRASPTAPSLPLAALAERAEGLVCLSGCAGAGALVRGGEQVGRSLLAAFGRERFRVELQRPLWRHDRARNRALAHLAERLGVPCVATGDAHFHHPRRAQLQDALVAVRHGITLDESEPLRRGNSASCLASPEEMARRFADHPEALAESAALAERLRFDLTRDLGYRYPGAEDAEADRALAEICRSRLEHRYRARRERREAARRLEEELRVIRSLGLSGFFLLHFDILELAREVAAEVRGPGSARGLLPPGRGRGSSVSSIVCYLTGLSHVDPVRNALFLGRFLNEEATEMPDIDLDFPRDIRERLIVRVHERYGRERSALVAAFACYQSRGATRDLGKALGLPPGEIERVARAVDLHDRPGSVAEDIAAAIGPGRARSPRWRALAQLAREAWGLPRHVSQHPGGMVLSTRPLVELCPVQPAAMEGRQLVQWDKDSCADAGFLKIDLLGLGMLSAVERCVEEIARARGERIDLSRIPLDDPATYAAIQAAETTGAFQIESRAQMQMLPRTRPESLDDLTVQVALVRPGPIQGGAVHPYLERKARLREDPSYQVPYEHPSLEPILRDTLGAIVFQEQVIQVAMALAGFSAGEAEGLRRAMSRKRSEEAILGYRERFIAGALRRGVERAVAERVFEQVRGFSGFGFPKAHAAAFGLLAYQSTWLRVHYGPEFLCSLLNEQPMGFYPPDSLVHEAQRRGIEVLPPDVNRSAAECSVTERLAVRIGLGYVTGLGEDAARRICAERERAGPYASLEDLASRACLGRDALERLAWAGACEPFGSDRRAHLWRAGVAAPPAAQPRRAASSSRQLSLPLPLPPAPGLPELGGWERVATDYASTGITLGPHPMELIRPELGPGLVRTDALPRLAHGARVELAGMVVARQRPATARGVVFMLLEDEAGVVNVIVAPSVYRRHRLAVRTAAFLRIAGKLERRGAVINLVARTLEALATPDALRAQVHHIEPPAARETGRAGAEGQGGRGAAAAAGRGSPASPGASAGDPRGRRAAAAGAGLADLAAVAPRPHSFGRRR